MLLRFQCDRAIYLLALWVLVWDSVWARLKNQARFAKLSRGRSLLILLRVWGQQEGRSCEPRVTPTWAHALAALQQLQPLNIFNFNQRGIGWARFDQWRQTASPVLPTLSDPAPQQFWTLALRCALLAIWLASSHAGDSSPLIIAAIGADTNWYVRAGGNQLNGGGFDSTLAGAGTNYNDQDAAQLSPSDLTTVGAGSTTITSIAGGFTSAMVGNCIRIASGTNFQTGYYFIVTFTDVNNVVLDRTPTSGAAGALGTGRIGGAHATLVNYANGGSLTGPTITSPLAAGHTVWIRGAGSDNPSSADYSPSGGYWTFPDATEAVGRIKWIGYNGRPRFNSSALLFYNINRHYFENLKFVYQNSSNGTLGVISGASDCAIYNVYVDQAGFDAVGVVSGRTVNCWFTNSGSSSAGTYTAIASSPYGSIVYGNFINGWRGAAMKCADGANIRDNCIVNCKLQGIILDGNGAAFPITVSGNTIYACTSDGVKFNGAYSILNAQIYNNIFVSNGGYGINCAVGTTALNDRRSRGQMNFNAFYNNTSGARNAISAGANDITLTGDPFTNAAGGDFSLNATASAGAACRSVGFPSVFPGATSTSYVDLGASQHQRSGNGIVFRTRLVPI